MDSSFIVGSVNYWYFFGVLYLIRLCYQDYKRMLVDDRHNYFMLGLSISLLSHLSRPLWYLLVLVVLVFVIDWLSKKYGFVGLGDSSAVRWIFLGFGYINPYFLAVFVVVWVWVHLFYWFLKRVVFRLGLGEKSPYFGVLLSSFVITVLLVSGVLW